MLKIKAKHSIILSIGLSAAFFIVCGYCLFSMPRIVNLLLEARNSINYFPLTNEGKITVLVLAYLVLLIAISANSLLLSLLLNVRNSQVFTDKNVSLIRGVSWCCLGIIVVFCGLGIYFHLAFILAFVALFLGLCLRVVKNAFEEAIEIKSENDLTV